MTETKVSDLIGLAELAETLGVSKNEANAIRQRAGFPTPVVKFKMGPAWDRAQVLSHMGRQSEQRHSILCAWCGGSSFLEAETGGFDRTGTRLTCVDCSKVSSFSIAVDDHDHFANGLSLKVTKHDEVEF